MPRILVVDDDMFFRKVITKILTGHGYEIVSVDSGEAALQILQTRTFDLMISDVNMTPMNGMELLKKVCETIPGMGVIMLTGHDEIGIAIEAMKKGAFDFLVKPFQLDELFSTVQRSLEYYNISPENKPLRARLDMLEGLVAESAGMRKICDIIRRVAPANITVLLSGGQGTPKEIIARAIHYYSSRKDKPFAVFDCSAAHGGRLAAELFGAAGSGPGVFKTARGGTLFLDNIDALPLDLQAGILDVIQNSKNGSAGAETDIRLIAASAENPEALSAEGKFHVNLYYRLSALHIEIPPLRDRPEDVPFIIDQAIRRNLPAGAEAPALDSEARDILCGYVWPGNDHELEEAVRHALPLAQNGVITRETLPASIVEAFDVGIRSDVIAKRRDQFKGQAFKTYLRGKEKELLNPNPSAGNQKESPPDKGAGPRRIKG